MTRHVRTLYPDPTELMRPGQWASIDRCFTCGVDCPWPAPLPDRPVIECSAWGPEDEEHPVPIKTGPRCPHWRCHDANDFGDDLMCRSCKPKP